MSTIVKTSAFEAALRAEPECPSDRKEEARKKLADNHTAAMLAAKLQVAADDVGEQLGVLICTLTEAVLEGRVGMSKEAHAALERIEALGEAGLVAPEDWKALTKMPLKANATKKDMRSLREMLSKPRAPYYFNESDTSAGYSGIVSNPSSPFMALGGSKGCMGPNVVESKKDAIYMNVIAPTPELTAENAKSTLDMCKNNVPFVLEAFLELMVSAPELEPHVAVFRTLFEIVGAYDECSPSDALERVGLRITALCQMIGDATMPRIHAQQLMEFECVELVFHALSESSHTVDEIAAAVTAYLKAQEHYASVARSEYTGKFVKIADVLEVAESASRASRASRKRKLSASDEWLDTNGKQMAFWDAHRDAMLKYEHTEA